MNLIAKEKARLQKSHIYAFLTNLHTKLHIDEGEVSDNLICLYTLGIRCFFYSLIALALTLLNFGFCSVAMARISAVTSASDTTALAYSISHFGFFFTWSQIFIFLSNLTGIIGIGVLFFALCVDTFGMIHSFREERKARKNDFH